MERCNNCNNSKLVMDNATGEIFCANCGYVLSERIEERRAEWRAFNKEEFEDRSRAGMPTSLAMHDMGLATVIGEDKDYTGKALSVQTKIMMGRLRKWDERSMRSIEERNLKQAFYELDKLKGKLAINDNVVEQAAYIYRKILEKRMIRGRRIQVLVVSSLYAACRLYEIPKTLKDIAASANVKRKDIARCYRMIVKVLDLQMPIADPVKCVNRIASNAGISERAKRTAIDILKRAEEAKISAGKNPMALAAGALYLASIMHREKKTQKDLAEAAGVTEVTIRNVCSKLAENLQMPVARLREELYKTKTKTKTKTKATDTAPSPTPTVATTSTATVVTAATITDAVVTAPTT